MAGNVYNAAMWSSVPKMTRVYCISLVGLLAGYSNYMFCSLIVHKEIVEEIDDDHTHGLSFGRSMNFAKKIAEAAISDGV